MKINAWVRIASSVLGFARIPIEEAWHAGSDAYPGIFHRSPKVQQSYLRLLSLFALTPLLALSAMVNGQPATATLKGAAPDAGGNAVPGAVVTLTNTATNLKKPFTTDEGGRFTFTFIEPGFYALDAQAAGFKTYHHPRLQLEVGQAIDLNISLAPGDVKETVNIVATEPAGAHPPTSPLRATP